MSTQANVGSIDALKDFRVALALFSEDALAALGAVDTEIKRTVQWLQHDRREHWGREIKRAREAVASAKAEVFRRQLAKTPDNNPAMSEQKELLRRAEAQLREAEARAALVKKWEPELQRAALDYKASTRRIKGLASGDVLRAMALLEKLIDTLESYLNISLPSGSPSPPPLVSVADDFLSNEPVAIAEDESCKVGNSPAIPPELNSNSDGG